MCVNIYSCCMYVRILKYYICKIVVVYTSILCIKIYSIYMKY